MKSKSKILVFVPHYFFPPNFGGAVRVYEIIRRLVSKFNLYIFVLWPEKIKHPFRYTFTIQWHSRNEFIKIIPISLRVIRFAKKHKVRVFLIEYTSVPSCIFGLLLKLLNPRSIIIVDAHNVEYISKKKRWNVLAKAISFLFEYLLVNIANVLVTVSKFDRRIFRKIFNRKKPIIVLPNGINIDLYENSKRDENFRRKYKPCAVTHGIYSYKYNKDMYDFIITRLAPKLPNLNFVIFGKETENIKKEYKNIPSNVHILGELPYKRIPIILKSCDIAVVPLAWGAGTNLKMIEYLAAGLTIVATKMASRGLDLIPGKHYYEAKLDERDFIEKIKFALNNRLDEKLLLNKAREFDWSYNVKKLIVTLQRFIN